MKTKETKSKKILLENLRQGWSQIKTPCPPFYQNPVRKTRERKERPFAPTSLKFNKIVNFSQALDRTFQMSRFRFCQQKA